MDKKDWKESLKKLEEILKKQKQNRNKIDDDIEELAFTINCYKDKVKSL